MVYGERGFLQIRGDAGEARPGARGPMEAALVHHAADRLEGPPPPAEEEDSGDKKKKPAKTATGSAPKPAGDADGLGVAVRGPDGFCWSPVRPPPTTKR